MPDAFDASPLTAFEREILGLAAESVPVKRIAAELRASFTSVRVAWRAACGKLGAKSRSHAGGA